ncbi:hypothetical protein Droror1_Dr00008806 [Drosera rotundifolia]
MAYNRRREEKKRDTGGQGGSDSLRRPSPPPISRTTTPKQSLFPTPLAPHPVANSSHLLDLLVFIVTHNHQSPVLHLAKHHQQPETTTTQQPIHQTQTRIDRNPQEFPAGKIHSITPSNTNSTVETLTPSTTKSSTLPHQSVNNPEATPPTPPLLHLNPSRITIHLQSTLTRRGEGAAPVDAAAREGEGKGSVGDAGVVVKMAGAARVRR